MASSTRGARTVILSGVAAQLSVATVGALPWVFLPLTAALYAGGSAAADRAEGKRAEALRWIGSLVAAVSVAALVPQVIGADDRQQVKQSLGVLLIATQIGQGLGWRSRRDIQSGLLASAGLLVLAASYAPDVLIGAPLLIGWAAVVTALTQLRGLRGAEVVRATSLALLLGLVAFLVIPVPPSAGARSRLADLAGPLSIRDRSAPGAFSSDQLDLRQRGSLPPTAVASVPLDSPQLWRSGIYQHYDGVSWYRTTQPFPAAGSGPTYRLGPASGPTRTDVVELSDQGQDPSGDVWAPGQVVELTPPPGGRLLRDDLGDLTVPGLAGSYRLTSVVPETDLARLTSTQGPDVADQTWRGLPTSLPARVISLSRSLTAGATSRYAAAAAIVAYLHTNETYQLDSPVPLPGQDAVDRFLFTDHVGFCEQFASAEVVLLRASGIPARLVTGLAYGVQQGDRRLLRDADRHAWAELYVPGTGWVSSDPTAGSTVAATTRSSVSTRARVAAAVSAALRRLVRIPGGRPALALLVLALALLGSVLIGRRPRRRRAAVRAAIPPTAGPALSAFLRWDARLGEGRRRAHESLRELLGRRAPVEPDLAAALHVVEVECYAPVTPPEQDVRRAVESLDSR